VSYASVAHVRGFLCSAFVRYFLQQPIATLSSVNVSSHAITLCVSVTLITHLALLPADFVAVDDCGISAVGILQSAYYIYYCERAAVCRQAGGSMTAALFAATPTTSVELHHIKSVELSVVALVLLALTRCLETTSMRQRYRCQQRTVVASTIAGLCYWHQV
jgi:hypothetical protein